MFQKLMTPNLSQQTPNKRMLALAEKGLGNKGRKMTARFPKEKEGNTSLRPKTKEKEQEI
jgi:predicted protein tyrosine phosphatase